MNEKRATLIYNPTAGALRRDPAQIDRIMTALGQYGWQITLAPTARAGHATELAQAAVANHDEVVIVCGGDGTINETAQALVGAETALAIWPGGTANVLAKDLCLPRNARDLAALIASGQTRRISVGRAVKPEQGWQRYFLLMAGIGLDATIVQSVDLELKRKAGMGAYVAAGLEFLAKLPLTPFSLSFNERKHDCTFAVIANAASYAACFTIAPQARLDDDKFDVCLFNAQSRLAYLSYAALSLGGYHTRAGGVVYEAAREAKANSNDAALVQLDGEVVGHLPMKFEIVPHALRLIAPATAANVQPQRIAPQALAAPAQH